jgi:uncharacterized membrane protein
MGKGRIEAFSDGVIAIIITIMVLELRPPEGENWRAIFDLWPVFLSYVLSFVNVGIYWSNHHHMLSRVTRVDGRILWLNLHLLFWLSLMPFATAVMGEGAFSRFGVALYGADLFLCSAAYSLLVRAFRALHGPESDFAHAVGRDVKGVGSALGYAAGFGLSFLSPALGLAVYAGVTAMWFIPDRRFVGEGA